MKQFEMNNTQQDSLHVSGLIKPTSPIVEVFAAMAGGSDMPKRWKESTVNEAVAKIKQLGEMANAGDIMATAELNSIRTFIIQPLLQEEMRLLSIFGSYKNLAYGESAEFETFTYVGEKSRFQANNGDVVLPAIERVKQPVTMVTISGGHQVDYRAVAMGDMQRENELMEQIRVDIRNKAVVYIIKYLYNAIKNATGVKYFSEGAGITKTALDAILTKTRKFGRPSIVGPYAAISQINSFVGWSGEGSITGVSQTALDEILKTGLISFYNGNPIAETPNPYDLTTITGTGADKNFATYGPEGLIYVVPSGNSAPVGTFTRGGLTTFSGNDVATGKRLTRFDLEVGAAVAEGREFEIGLINDTNLSPVSFFA